MKSGDIEVKFLPPNVTSLIQPMDLGVLEALKRNYLKLMLRFILLECDDDETVKDGLKKINIKQVMYWCTETWKDIKLTTLQKSLSQLFDGLSLNDENQPSDEDIIQMVRSILVVKAYKTIK